MDVFEFRDGDRLAAGRVDLLPLGMIRLDPGGHVEADHLPQHLGASRVRRIDPRPQFGEGLGGDRHARHDVDDLPLTAEDEGAAGEADSRRVGATADHVRSGIDHLCEGRTVDAEAEALVRAEPRWRGHSRRAGSTALLCLGKGDGRGKQAGQAEGTQGLERHR